MNKTLLRIAKEELAEKKEFLLELTSRLQNDISKGSKYLQKTVTTMNKVVSEIEVLESEIKREQYKEEIKELWTSRWDYISLTDAIKEVRTLGYTDLRINDLKLIYNEIEQYQ